MQPRLPSLLCLSVLAGIISASAQVIYEPYIVTTLAGYNGHGSKDGVGNDARFYQPQSTALDRAGNIYVTDSASQIIRKITPEGVTTTLAGLNGVAGSSDGTGTEARFDFPRDLGIDQLGNLYVADSYNSTIRKITPAGVVTTLAGLAGSPGYVDGTGSEARFSYPLGLTVNSKAEVYVGDFNNQKVRKITPEGVVTTILPDYLFFYSNLYGFGVDSQDNIYLAGGDMVKKITDDSVVTDYSFLGNGYYFGTDVAFDSHQIGYVTELLSGLIFKIDAQGVATIFAGGVPGGSADGKGTRASFNQPYGLSIDRSGNLYVADTANDTIRKVTRQAVVTTFAGLANTGSRDGIGEDARFRNPQGIATNQAGISYVADSGNDTIRQVTPEGEVTTLAGKVLTPGLVDGVGGAARFNYSGAAAVDSAGNLFIADTNNHVIREMTPSRRVTTLAGNFNAPHGVAVNAAGLVYVANSLDDTIEQITPGGVVTTLAGLKGVAAEVDGTGSAARFNLPYGIALDPAGNLYVADYGSNRIRKVTSTGVVTTVAGLKKGHNDGVGSGARFSSPTALTVDAAGNVYICDSGNHTLRKMTSSYSVTTLAGAPEEFGWVDGIGAAARFESPWGVAVDSSGRVLVADWGNSAIRQCVPAP
jgi:streptogramin lyase